MDQAVYLRAGALRSFIAESVEPVKRTVNPADYVLHLISDCLDFNFTCKLTVALHARAWIETQFAAGRPLLH